MPNIGPTELIIVLVIVLIFVGPKKLPGLGKSLGTGLREFKDSVSGGDKDDAQIEPSREAQAPVAPPATPPAAEPVPLKKDPATPPAPPRDAGE